MRKDVRMGFAVGGVLLAVIIVAVLVIHRNRNSSKTVALDGPGKGSVTPTGTGDSASAVGDATPAPAAQAPGEVVTPPAPADSVAAVSEQPKPAQDDSADKSGGRWDALFASTSEDPLKSQLTSDSSKSKSRKSGSSAGPKRESAAEAVANAQIDAGSQPLTARPSSVNVVAASTSVSTTDSPRTHKVASGETFVSISRAVYGDGRYFQAIVDANPTVSPQKLKPGMMIQIPAASQVKKAKAAKSTSVAASSGPALASDGKTYTVQSGDNLYKIAKKLYGNGEKGGDLYALNKQVIGADSTKLKIGMVLKLLDRATVSASR